MLETYLRDLPLIAILRGLTPAEAVPVGRALYDAGLRMIEVPLNSPEPLDSIRRLVDALGEGCLIGAGTVLSETQVEAVVKAGGRLIVSPNMNPAVIRASRAAGLVSAPGVATPSEAFAALEAGADVLKLFPAEQLGPAVLKAWRAVLPADCPLLPVGGITPEGMAAYRQAGASGFGLGSALYRPGQSAEAVGRNARDFANAWHALAR
ncbi:2-dehydro-3-deoxy-6-phosphogalactonate aldolase [Stutzerimonas urumqiensis]|uniref:2-dehydro-3-deoxy-6-phosphogalactonate aldolase n=1 Tax=Stutzerimonas urumqiensis TaxID=638269 RepID=UPI003BAC1EDD